MELPARDHRITLLEAAAHTRRHREAKGSAVHAHAFHADQVLALLQQPGCAALRIYHGQDARGAPSLVLVAADAAGEDMVGGAILEQGAPCPPFCSSASDLHG
jgi:hypothetical protein